ncbi:uncharacterized protein N7459_007664 [Penicillium hispanicum]|uniref:uncharacterized protein n=1 Tax=Penicillium hispanicum TaxID=1080232 RepID=UPI0025402EC4|nr:uncharacterized protein N7459_007664 [Penicillium hispanicum]KAJ5578700.1 hypothetical protein N7459_007664 [Penicillium hispanicum]
MLDVSLPYGGYPRVVSAGWNDNYLPLWMQDAGYNTYFVSKLWNSHTEENYNPPYTRGFNGSDFLLDALVMVLKSCGDDPCRYPWRQLHPAGIV